MNAIKKETWIGTLISDWNFVSRPNFGIVDEEEISICYSKGWESREVEYKEGENLGRLHEA